MSIETGTPGTPAAAPNKTEKSQHEGKALTTGGIRTLIPQNFAEAERIASLLAKSDIVPKELIGKPANILLVLMFGSEIGLSPAQALQNVMVVNSRPSLWGDAIMGLVEQSQLMEAWKDTYDPKLEDGAVTFTVKRKGREPVTRTFSMEDAKKAGLAGKAGPWTQYPKRMLFHRARSWALRDAFPDILKGLRYFEEERDVVTLKPEEDGKTYSLPRATDESAPGPAATQGKPAAVEAPASMPQVEPSNAEQPVKVKSVASTELKGKPVFVVRFEDQPEAKFYTENEGISKLAQQARDKGFAVVLDAEERDGAAWIVSIGRAEQA